MMQPVSQTLFNCRLNFEKRDPLIKDLGVNEASLYWGSSKLTIFVSEGNEHAHNQVMGLKA